jgi:hypothetical protein
MLRDAGQGRYWTSKGVQGRGSVFEATLSVFTEKFSKCRSKEISNCLRPTGRVFEISAKAFDESVKTVRSEKTDPDRRASFLQNIKRCEKLFTVPYTINLEL